MAISKPIKNTSRRVKRLRNKKIKVTVDKLGRIGVSRVEMIKTRQGEQMIDTKKLSRTMKKLDKLIETPYKTYDESKEAEEEFREFLKKQGYTRF